ncbi:MAG: hypothetical protein KBA66_08730, partial [Leptospiraceae bacterium]|nr:hypothetical protein [Leptospiraceae bacterium]
LFKDLLHPFSDSVGFEWQGEMNEQEGNLKLYVKILQNNDTILYELSMFPDFSAPGVIEVQNKEGDKWILKKVE